MGERVELFVLRTSASEMTLFLRYKHTAAYVDFRDVYPPATLTWEKLGRIWARLLGDARKHSERHGRWNP